MMSEKGIHQARNKFNTLTPAEARKLNKSISLSRPPIRTASVLNKPRPPPIIVTNLDGLDIGKQQRHQNGASNVCEEESQQLSRANSIRSVAVCSAAANRRHSINYGAALRVNTLNCRLSLYSRNDVNQAQHSSQLATVPNESLSNLSFKSSHDIPDSAYNSANSACKYQTASVDLGSGMQNYRPSFQKQQSMFMNRSMRVQKSNTIARSSGVVEPCCLMNKYKNSTQKISDDSYVSAKSDISESERTLHSGYGSPQRQLSNLCNDNKSVSKASLTSSTYKVFQGPLANIKRFFRGSIPKKLDGDNEPCNDGSNEQSTNTGSPSDCFMSSLNKNISQISLDADTSTIFNRSQTPPVCPPPPGELKSMCYMNGTSIYPNYDEFTKSRNERFAGRSQSEESYQRQTTSVLPRLPSQPPPVHRLSSGQSSNVTTITRQQQHHQDQPLSLSSLGRAEEIDAWQLTSLPVSYERNLTTVFEEQKQQLQQNPSLITRIPSENPDFVLSYQSQKQQSLDSTTYLNGLQLRNNNNLINPPSSFDNYDQSRRSKHSSGVGGGSALTSNNSKTSSNQSLASTTTTDSILEYQLQQRQQVPASPYRFSFAQPPSPPAPIDNVTTNQRINGLPPRVPSSNSGSSYQNQQTTTTSALTDSSNSGGSVGVAKKLSDNNSSSGNSSNCSSQLNVINNCDRLDSLESSDQTFYSNASSSGQFGGNLNGLENDIDTTILSETSTLQGDPTGASFYMNKCCELERAVTSLKNKLVTRDKELTDLQLSQLHNDYTIDKLKSQVNKLEKENSQLKSLLSTIQGAGQQSARTNAKYVRS